MADPSVASQKALYVALSAALSCSVYDSVPKRASYPYVVIERQDIDNSEPLASRREVRRFYLSIWSTYPGQKEILEILSAIDLALHNKRLSLETGRMVIARIRRRYTQRDLDGETFQGQVQVEVITEH
jgi:hypothetical protein